MHATSLSPGVLRMVGLAASDFSFAAASDLLWELAAVRVETKQVERCAEALGREVAAEERDVAEPLMALDFAVPRSLAGRVGLASGSCSSGRSRFLQTPPRDDALALR